MMRKTPSIKTPTRPFDKESILLLFHQKNWKKLIEILKDNALYDAIKADALIESVLKNHFVNELLDSQSFENDITYKYYLEEFYGLHSGPNFHFQFEGCDYKRLVIKLAEEFQTTDQQRAVKYASKLPQEDVCKALLEKLKPTSISTSDRITLKHSQSASVSLTTNINISEVDLTCKLFKSQQEYLFFKAVRKSFSTFLIYPNMALSSTLEHDLILPLLSDEEKKYFYKALIDCVVIDQENNYRPSKFIELDSHFHDETHARQKDLLKDSILAKAGKKLYRIRNHSAEQTEEKFSQLIREVIHLE